MSVSSINYLCDTCKGLMCVLTLHRDTICVRLITLNLVFLVLGRKRASAALASKPAFGHAPRVHWEERGQRESLSHHHGMGCEEITGNDNKCLYQRLGAACSHPKYYENVIE